MKGKTKKWISGILSLAMLASVSVATSKLLVRAAEETTTQTATVSNVDTTTTNAAWQKSYGKNGYIVMAGSVKDDKKTDYNRVNFYSDMYAEKTGTDIIVAANTMGRNNGNSQYTYLTSGDEMSYGLNETAPISKWGLSTLGWSLRTDFKGNRTLAIPGSTTDYTYAGVLNANTHDMSIYFTKTSESKELVTVYASSMNNSCSGSAPITVAAYSGSTTYVHVDKAVEARDFYTSKGLMLLASTDITSAGYVTFEIEGAGDYQIAVYDAAKSNRPSIQGIFFDEYVEKDPVIPVEQTATAIFTNADDTTGAKWEGTYGADGYLVFEGKSAGQDGNAPWNTYAATYSDMYEGDPALIKGNARTQGVVSYFAPKDNRALRETAPISRWGAGTFAWWANGDQNSIYAPGTETETEVTLGMNKNTKTTDMSVFFTLKKDKQVYVTIHVIEMWKALSEECPLDVFVFKNHKMAINGTGEIKSFYGEPLTQMQITKQGYVTFVLSGKGDYEIVVASNQYNPKTNISKAKPSISGIFFDYDLAKAEGINVYKVDYKLNEGETNHADNPTTYVNNQSITLQPAIKENAKFVGWYTNAEFSGEAVTTLTGDILGNLTLYAKFVDGDVYTITYELNGGTNGEGNPATYNEFQTITLENATKANHTFDGWYANAEFTGEPVTQLTKTYGNVTLYAKFTEMEKKNVTYVLGDYATLAPDTPMVYYLTVGLTLEDPVVKQHCAFEGWYTNAEFTGDPVTQISADETVDITLYAKVSLVSWTITLTTEKADVAFVDEAKTMAFVDNDTITFNYYEDVELPTLYYSDGTVFDGWYDEYDELVSDWIIGEYNGDLTLTAKTIEPIATYTVTFNSDGGSTVASATVNEGEKVTKPADPVKAADAEYTYAFAGWYNGETAWNFDTDTVTADVTLTAKWTATAITPPEDNSTDNNSAGGDSTKKSSCRGSIETSATIICLIIAVAAYVAIKKGKNDAQ